MKVLELCLSKSLGGLELYFLNTCKKLGDYGPLFCVARADSRLAESLGSGVGKSYTLRSKCFVFQAMALIRIIESEQVDVIHIHHKNDLPVGVFAKRLCNRKLKLVYTRQMAWPKKKKDLYHKFIYNQVDLILVISKQLRESAVKNLPVNPKKVKLLYYGVSPTTNDDKSPFKDGEQREFRIGVFSRIGYKKGHHILLGALDKLKNKELQVVVDIYGDVMDSKYYNQLKKYLFQHGLENVQFKGFLSNPASVMGHYDTIVVPSLNETFGLVAVEAMLMQTPVVASDSGGLTEIIEHERTGLLFETGNTAALAIQLERLIRHSDLRERLAENGLREAKQKFNEEAHYEELIKLMRQTLSD